MRESWRVKGIDHKENGSEYGQDAPEISGWK
jgi:hypothetical protein